MCFADLGVVFGLVRGGICRGRSERARRRRAGFYGGRDGDLVIWSGGGWRAPGFVACPRFGPSGAAAGDVLVVLPWGT